MKSVDQGAALLDERVPGWRRVVSPHDLDLGHCERCVLGQIFGEYEVGLAALNLSDAQALALGFAKRTTTWERLTEAWREKMAR